MIKIIERNFNDLTGKYECTFVLDAAADANSLPTDCSEGSVAIVAGTGAKVYMVNASGSWEGL